MNEELPSEKKSAPPSLDQRFAHRPHLRRRLHSIADLIDQSVAEGCSAHEAEARAIEQIRPLGQEVLRDWAEQSEAAARRAALQKDPGLRSYKKKD